MTDLYVLRDQIAQVLVDHSYDHEVGECMCGARGDNLAEHVAQKILDRINWRREVTS
jgi:hypothetical protein